MPVMIEQTAEMAPGHVRAVCRGSAALAGETLEVRIARVDLGSPRFLDPRFDGAKAWNAAECWFRVGNEERGEQGFAVALDAAVTWHLKPHMPYLISFRGGAGEVVEERMSWPAIRLPSEAPPPSPPEIVSLDQGTTAEAPAPEAPAPPQDEPDEPQPEPDAEDPLAHFAAMAEEAKGEGALSAGTADGEGPAVASEAPPSERRRGRGLIFAGLALCVLAAAGAYVAFVDPGYLAQREEASPPEPGVAAPAESPEPETTLAGAREFLRAQPSADEAVEQAKRHVAAGQEEGAFLLYSYAARNGSAEAALWLGDRYNPATWSGGVLKSPDPDRAAELYRQAAQAKVPEAMESLAALLQSGLVADEDAPEQAEFWLRKAKEARANEKKEAAE